MLGYKVGKHDDTRVIITLEIPEDAITNINRKDIAYVNKCSITNFVNGKMDGVYSRYNDNGVKIEEYNHVNGIRQN